MLRVSLFVVLLSIALISEVCAKINSGKHDTLRGEASFKTTNHKSEHHVDHKKEYAEYLKQTRVQHASAIQSIKGIEATKLRSYVEDVLRNVKNLLISNREVLERIGHDASDPFPYESETLKTSLAKIIENTAFLSDLFHSFSNIVRKVVKKDRKFLTVIVWAQDYSARTGLLDESTSELVSHLTKLSEEVEKKTEDKKTDKSKRDTTTRRSKDLKPVKNKKQTTLKVEL